MKLWRVLRSLTRWLRGSSHLSYSGSAFGRLTENFERLLLATRFFYLCSFANAVMILLRWDQLHDIPMDQPRWPLLLFPWPEMKSSVISLSQIGYTVGSLVAIFRPFDRFLRVLVFLGLFLHVALINSDGHYSHNMHLMMYPTFLLMFLPSQLALATRRIQKYRALVTFWGAQLAVCVAYQMAGYSKITEIFRCLHDQGVEGCAIGAEIMTNMAAMESIQYDWPTFSGDLLYDFPLFGGVSYYAVIWIHSISLIFPFRFHLHRFFVAYRTAFHFGTLIFFGIGFSTSILAVVSVFALSPFFISASWKTCLRDIPPLRLVFR